MANPRKQEDRSGNTAELERLEGELATEKQIRKTLETQNATLKKDADDFLRRLKEAEAALTKTQEKIAEMEKSKAITGTGESAKEGYVTLATLPLGQGTFPRPGKIGDIPILRKIEDGVLYEQMPVKNAIGLMSDGSAFKRAFLGPGDKIEGDTVKHQSIGGGVHGNYAKHLYFNRHKVAFKDTEHKKEPYFMEVFFEESKQKVE